MSEEHALTRSEIDALQSPLAYGGDATATATTAGLPSSPLPPPLFVPGGHSPPHGTFFVGADLPAESPSHAPPPLFGGGDMGMLGAADHELLIWDSFAYPSTFSNGMLAALPIPFVN